METKLSKHGKYWIITGTPEDLYDEMQPGDLVKDFEGDWFELLHVADFADMSQASQLIMWLFHPDSVWWVRDMEDETEKYLPFDKNDYVLKIKRPVADGIIPGNYTPLGTLTGDATFTEKPEAKKKEPEAAELETKSDEKELPEEQGLYTDHNGCLWLFMRENGEMSRYFYSLLTHLMISDLNGDIAKKSAPFRLVKSLEREVE